MQDTYRQTPNTRHISTLLSALAKAGQDQLAMQILEGMMDGSDNESTVDNAGIDTDEEETNGREQRQKHAWTATRITVDIPQTKQRLELPRVALTRISINSVLHALAQNGKYETARQFLEKMKRGNCLGIETGTDRKDRRKSSLSSSSRKTTNSVVLTPILPDTVTYNTVLSACRNAKDAEELVQEVS